VDVSQAIAVASIRQTLRVPKLSSVIAVLGDTHLPRGARKLPERCVELLRGWFPECEVIAYGHSHLPEIRSYDGCWIVNPGSPTDRRRAPAHTIAVLEEGTPRLVEV
jgi:hypothetical protein